MKINKMPPVGHIGVVVKDLEKATFELKKLYGLEGLDKFYNFIPMRCWAWGKEIEKCRIKICMVDWIDGLKLEILQPVMGEIEHERFVRECGGGMHHTAYYVEDYPGYRDFVLQNDGEIIFETETEDDVRGYRRCLYARLPESQLVIEILEIAWFRDKK